jgi:Lipase (class 3)
MSESIYNLPVPKDLAYALVSMCAATYTKSLIEITAAGIEKPESMNEAVKATRNDLVEPFRRIDRPVPDLSDFALLRHKHQTAQHNRLGGFTLATKDYLAVVFRGTAYSDEWIANLSFAVPAVRSKRQLVGLILFSFLPFLRNFDSARRLFDFQKGFAENACYLQHLYGLVAQVKDFLDNVIKEETELTELKKRRLYITGHSLGGAAAIVTCRRLILSWVQTVWLRAWHVHAASGN